MKIFNKDFGNRIWGASIALWMIICLNADYALWMRIISAICVIYFFWFGDSRFTEDYRKIIKV